MKWTDLVTLMDAEAARCEQDNNHSAAVLLREGAEQIRKLNTGRPKGDGIGNIKFSLNEYDKRRA